MLDLIAANMTPVVVGSILKDENGQALSEQAQARAEHIQELRSRISGMEKQLHAAKEGLDISLQQLRRLATAQLNTYRECAGRLQGEMLELATAETAWQDSHVKQQLMAYSSAMETVCRSWETFGSRAGDFIRLLADSRQTPEGMSGLFALKALDQWGNAVTYAEGEMYYEDMRAAQEEALKNQHTVDELEAKLLNARAEYSNALCG